jgi:hypothetical protein
MDRKEHLLEHHSFPPGFDFSFVHGRKERSRHESNPSRTRRRGKPMGGKRRQKMSGRMETEMPVGRAAKGRESSIEMEEEKEDDLISKFKYLHVKESVPKEISFGRRDKR